MCVVGCSACLLFLSFFSCFVRLYVAEIGADGAYSTQFFI